MVTAPVGAAGVLNAGGVALDAAGAAVVLAGGGVVVVVARTNRLKELRPLVQQMLEAVAKVNAGELIRVEQPGT